MIKFYPGGPQLLYFGETKDYSTQHTLMYHAGSSLHIKQTAVTMTIGEVTAIFPLSTGRSVVGLGGRH